MEPLLNYVAFEIQKDGRLVAMATEDHCFVDLKLNKVNFIGSISQLEQIF